MRLKDKQAFSFEIHKEIFDEGKFALLKDRQNSLSSYMIVTAFQQNIV